MTVILPLSCILFEANIDDKYEQRSLCYLSVSPPVDKNVENLDSNTCFAHTPHSCSV